MNPFMRPPPEHLRNGKLSKPDQAERDQMIVERFRAGATYRELEAAFLISKGTVWAAIRTAQPPMPATQRWNRGLRK